MKKNIQIGIVATTISFFFIYVIIIALTNPLECVVCRNIILIAFSIYTLLMIGYWVYCVLCLLVCSGADRKVGILFLLSMILFFIIPPILNTGFLNKSGTILLVLNQILWWVYFIKTKDVGFLILICVSCVVLLTSPYCGILWD